MKFSLALWVFLTGFILFQPPTQAAGLVFYTENYPPYNYKEEKSGQLKGIAVEIVQDILKRTGFAHEIRMAPWKRGYEITLSQKNTCLFSTGRTKERENLFKWVTPFTEVSLVLFARADSHIQIDSLEDAHPYQIGGYLGDAATDFLVRNNIAVETVANDQLNLKKLQNGRIDLWATGEYAGLKIAEMAGQTKLKKVYNLISLQGGVACNLQTDDIILMRMREELHALYQEGRIKEIYQNYMPNLSLPSF